MMLLTRSSAQRQFWFDTSLLWLLTIGLFWAVLSTQTTSDLFIYDTFWYTNRANMIWRGILYEPFVYTFAYPLILGALNLGLHELTLAALLTNAISAGIMQMGIYWLGRQWFHRAVGFLAALLVVLNPEWMIVARETQPPALFMCTVVLCLVAYVGFTLQPTMLRAFLLGAAITLALYTRFEGILFSILIPIALWQCYRRALPLAHIIRWGISAGSILAIGTGFYLLVLLRVSDSSGNVFSFFFPFATNPPDWEQISWRITAVLHSIFYHWSLIHWLLIFGIIALSPGKWVFPIRLLAGLFLWYAFGVYLLAVWPFPSRAMFGMPLMALLLALALWRISQLPRVGMLLAAGLLLLTFLPGLRAITHYMRTPSLAYRQESFVQNVRDADAWLIEQGWQDKRILTFCWRALSYTDMTFYTIFRLTFSEKQAATSPDSPYQTLPVMAERGDLYMECTGGTGFTGTGYTDWDIYFETPGEYTVEKIGQIHEFSFYRVVRTHP